MIEERTEGLSIKNMAGNVIWPRPCSKKARYRLLGNWHNAILAIVEQISHNDQLEVLKEDWKYTVSLRVVTGTSERLFNGTGHGVDGRNY